MLFSYGRQVRNRRSIRRLFGRGGYALVNRPENLTAALPRIYRQITCS